MATYTLTGFDPADISNITNPGGAFALNDKFRLDPDWSKSTDAYTYTITDDDAFLSGDAANNESGDDTSQQTAVVTDALGNTVASGRIYLETAYFLTDEFGATVTLYTVEIGGVAVGYVADGPIQPGNTYEIVGGANVTSSNEPSYSSFDPQNYEQGDNDNIVGTDNADVLHGGTGGDTINANDGDDTIVGGAGNDSVNGGLGNDSIDGGDGNDTLLGQGGNDTILGGAGNDVINGGDGNDSIDGGSGDDDIKGGLGNDTIRTGTGSDKTAGEGGDDLIITTGDATGSDTLKGDAGTDTLAFEGDSVTVIVGDPKTGSYTFGSGGTGTFEKFEVLEGGDFDDSFDTSGMSAGEQIEVSGGGGNDSFTGGAATETFSGGTGDDTFVASAGPDTIATGDGNDLIRLTGDVTTTYITDFDFSDPGGTGQATDQFDSSLLSSGGPLPVRANDVSVGDDGLGNALLTFPGGEQIVLLNTAPAAVTPAALVSAGIPCFTGGTPIATPRGPRRADILRPGDVVSLAGGGAAPVLWVGHRTVTAQQMARDETLRPVRIEPRWSGGTGPLLVSRQHGIACRIAGADPPGLLVRAIQLGRLTGGAVREVRRPRAVTYVHLLLPDHGLLVANGLACESFYPSARMMALLDQSSRLSLSCCLPTLAAEGAAAAYGAPALPYARRRDLPARLSDLMPMALARAALSG